jgi:hypothetical protein
MQQMSNDCYQCVRCMAESRLQCPWHLGAMQAMQWGKHAQEKNQLTSMTTIISGPPAQTWRGAVAARI